MTESLRVAVVCRDDERLAPARLVDGLNARGHDVHLVTEPAEDERELSSSLARLGPQLVHAQSLELALACRESAPAGARVVCSVAGDGAELASYTGAEVPWHAADAFHFGDDASERLARRRGLPDRVLRTVVAPSAEPELFSTNGRLPGAPLRIVSVAPLHWAQGLEHAIHAVSLAIASGVDARYSIVGRGEHLPALNFARYQVGITDRVSLIEDECAAAGELRRAHLALSAQVIDGLAPGVVRAMAAGLPLAVTDPGALGDESPLPGAALLARRRDARSLSERIVELAADARLRARLGASARAQAAARHRPELELDGITALYESVIGCVHSAAPAV